MDDEMPTMSLRAIGVVRNEIQQTRRQDWENIISDIVFDPDLTEALDNLDEFSHVTVLYWMHQLSPERPPLKVHPRGEQELPLVGLFATRSPHRPNAVGKTIARLLQRQGNILSVQGLDAIDVTPVIDIKPYIPGYDSVNEATVPRWITDE